MSDRQGKRKQDKPEFSARRISAWAHESKVSEESLEQAFEKALTTPKKEMYSVLCDEEYIALRIDTDCFKGRDWVIVKGITTKGEMKLLGLKEGETANAGFMANLLESLLSQGFPKQAFRVFVENKTKVIKSAVLNTLGKESKVIKLSKKVKSLPTTEEMLEVAINTNPKEAQKRFGEFMEKASIGELCALFKLEVVSLCGKSRSRKESPDIPRRGGWDKVLAKVGGTKYWIKKPRVKQNKKELQLKSYALMSHVNVVMKHVISAVLKGVSGRRYREDLEGLGVSSALVSQYFKSFSESQLLQLNTRDLSEDYYLALHMDTVYWGKQAIVMVTGITVEGEKKILGLKEGDTENTKVVESLLNELVDRGISKEASRIFVLDGAKALKKAVKEVFGERAQIQRCTLHKQRNIMEYVPRTLYEKFKTPWWAIFNSESLKEAHEKIKELEEWLKVNIEDEKMQSKALASLKEGQEELLTLIKLGIIPDHRKPFQSTNILESMIATIRQETNRVTHWQQGQAIRWFAAHLLLREKKLNRYHNIDHLEAVAEILRKKDEEIDACKLSEQPIAQAA